MLTRTVMRTAVGASVGALSGLGLVLTLDGLTRYCYLRPGRTGCGRSSLLTFPLAFSFWMLVAAALVCAGYRVLRADRGSWAAAIGSGLWFVLVLVVLYVRSFHLGDSYQEEVHQFLQTGYLTAACAAYAIAAFSTGSRRTA